MYYGFSMVPVDAGIIVIADQDHYKPYGPIKDTGDAYTQEIEEGEYAARWEMPETWNGKVKGKGHLSVTSGIIFVGDPCYLVANEKWDEYLKKCIWARKKPKGILILDKMGGDGSFDVKLELRRE